jgi:GDP-D-mannose 3', 5'-epimerase
LEEDRSVKEILRDEGDHRHAEEISDMKTIVTGGTGFIGSHLVKKLLADGREIVVVSDLSRLDTVNLSRLGITPSDVEIRRADLSESRQAAEAIKKADVVFHLAATVGSLEYLHGAEMAELDALQSNLMIDTNVFRACFVNGVKKIVYASSCAVYPMNRQIAPGAIFSESSLELKRIDFLRPQTSNLRQAVIDPDGGYGWAKLLGEIELVWMRNIDIGIARIFNIYGPNEPLGDKAHVVGDLISKVIRYSGEKFIVRGDGKQSRDFLFVSDCVDALLKLEEKASNPPITINVGSGKATEIGALAHKLANISEKDINIIFDPTKPVGPVSRAAATTMAKQLLNWQPQVSLEEGLKRTYEWIGRQLEG